MLRPKTYVPPNHPCPKHPDVWRWFVLRATPFEGESVCDPMIGSGTTAVACLRTGRRCIGIELDEKYFSIACKRVQDEIDRTALFNGVETVEVKRQKELCCV